jgi:hypothetical protein
MKKLCLGALLAALVLAGCTGAGEDPPKSGERSISAFAIGGVAGVVDEEAKTITVTLPYGTEDFTLAYTVSEHAVVSPKSYGGVPGDMVYTVTAEDGSTQDYTVRILYEEKPLESKSGEKSISAFSIGGVAGLIDQGAKTITVTLPYGTENFAVAYTASEYAEVELKSSGNVSGDMVYTVTAENGSAQDYTVRIIHGEKPQEEKSGEKSISAFSIGGVAGIIDQEAKTITVTLPYGAEDFTVAYTASAYAEVSLKSSGDVSGDMVYTVTAENGSAQDYTVRIIHGEKPQEEKSGEKNISAFSIGGVAGVIDESAKTITVTLPYGTENFAVAYTASEYAEVSLKSSGDVSGDMVYTVTAENGSTQDYTVRIVHGEKPQEEKSGEKSISAFSIGGVAGLIDQGAKTITVTLPYGTENLAAAYTASAYAEVSLKSYGDVPGVMVYTVTAENGSTQDYTVRILYRGQESVSIGFADEGAGALAPGAAISLSKTGSLKTTTLTAAPGYETYEWFVDAASKGTGRSLTLDAAAYAPGKHYLSLEVVKDGKRYSKELTFTVVQ